ncbi:flagellin [Massilia sp. 9096]|uniref:flagellin N-terminal helical domain-containing protein n=1 Tax=Massilia sp. 9096 TaxID=1500894 RepID=UPI00055EE13A|nr:flagellin [Massilia sp. 9096]
MTSVINTNIASLNAQRNLSSSQTSLQTSIQRLSSGLRINSAKDDAAGLAISSRMTSQINGMDQATRNANDGVSMAQTADGALSSSSDILQRIRQLAVQSSNASNTASDRAALQNEVTQSASELNRIAQTTQFNGQNLLDGSMGTASFQVGANAGQLISMTGANFTTSAYGNNAMTNNAPAAAAADPVTAGTMTIAGSAGSKDVAVTAGESAKDVAAGINAVSGNTGVTATAQTNSQLKATAGSSYTMSLNSDNSGSAVTVSFTVGNSGGATPNANDYSQAISAFNAQSSKTGVTASYDQTNGGIKLTNASGNDIKLKAATGSTADATLGTYTANSTTGGLSAPASAAAVDATGVVSKGAIEMDSNNSFSVTDGSGYGLGGSSSLKSVGNLDISTFDGAQQAIKIADAALAAVNNQRSQYGAIQNRFDSTISNLGTSQTNLSASRSRITDTDFASETANMTRSQILQQAGTSMLAQANSLPNGVMSLLRG